ncbi:MAG: hypothetical protein IBX44_03305 [Sulfurospirillum sp.]|nr:hypothetical protein [Sulfurospirillum sp.]
MKKILGLLLAVFVLVGVMSTSALADAAKGQKYYLKYMKKSTGINGGQFAAKHTQAEWKELFASDGVKFIETYSVEFPNAADFLKGDKFKKYMGDISDFLINFASDSGNVPSC